MTNSSAKRARTFCTHRDGPGCQMAPGTKRADGNPCAGQIVLDHIDGDRENNPENGSNWQNLCRGHNARKANSRPRGKLTFNKHLKLRHSRERELKKLRNTGAIRGMSVEMWKSVHAKPKIIAWIMDEIASAGSLLVEEAVNSGAFIGNCDQATVRKYIDTLTSKPGPLRRDFEGDDEFLYLKGKQ